VDDSYPQAGATPVATDMDIHPSKAGYDHFSRVDHSILIGVEMHLVDHAVSVCVKRGGGRLSKRYHGDQSGKDYEDEKGHGLHFVHDCLLMMISGKFKHLW